MQPTPSLHPAGITPASALGPRLGLLLATPGLALLLGCAAPAPEPADPGGIRGEAGALCLTGACGDAAGRPSADMVFDSDGRLILSQGGSAGLGE